MSSVINSRPLDEWSEDQTYANGFHVSTLDYSVATGRLHSVSMPAPEFNEWSLMADSAGNPRFYWAAPESPNVLNEVIAGVGVAAELTTAIHLGAADLPDQVRFSSIRTQVNQLFRNSRHSVVTSQGQPVQNPAGQSHPARPRLMGGFSFSPGFVPDNTWAVFHPAHFILPHFQYVESGGARWLTINAVANLEDDETEIVTDLTQALLAFYDLIAGQYASRESNGQVPMRPQLNGTRIRYPMSEQQWDQMVSEGVAAIKSNQLKKVVLSRVGEINLGKPVEPVAILSQLNRAYPSCYRFAFEPVPGHVFLGATPELLIQLSGDMFQTMALASSIRRGRSDVEDRELAQQLLASQKERHEHQLVVDEIRTRLAEVAGQIDQPSEPTILALHNIQHLYTPFDGRISDRASCDVLALVKLLHPTPALGGVPANRALQLLADVEPVPRGWYAAPIGWLDANLDGAFAVAIRSAICQHDRAWLYAGAGIVGDSVAEREWAETELKFKPMLEALTQAGYGNQ